jgi:uncharacterized protein HemX
MIPIELEVLTIVVGLALSVAAFFIGRKTAHQNAGKVSGIVETKLDYTESGAKDNKRKIEQNEQRHIEHTAQLATLTQDVKSIKRRLEKLEVKQ